MYGRRKKMGIGALMTTPNADIVLTDRAVAVVRECLRDFDEGLDFNVDHCLTGLCLAEVLDRELGKGCVQRPHQNEIDPYSGGSKSIPGYPRAFVQLPLEEQENLARTFARREKAETIVAEIRDIQLRAVHSRILREYPVLANEWRDVRDIIVAQLPEKLRHQLLGADFTHEGFIRAWLEGSVFSPGKIYDLTAPWQEWARENGLHPAFPPVIAPVSAATAHRQEPKLANRKTAGIRRGRKRGIEGGTVNEKDFKLQVKRYFDEGLGDAEIAGILNQERADYEPEITTSKVRAARNWWQRNEGYDEKPRVQNASKKHQAKRG